MKVISLLQPWATLVVLGHKKIETRSWNTSYRGPLLIHASAGKNRICKDLTLDFQQEFCQLQIPYYKDLPFGAIIGKVNMVGPVESRYCFEGNEFEDNGDVWKINRQELAFGDYSENRYGWLFSDPVQFAKPVPAKGSLGLWNFDMTDHLHYPNKYGGHSTFSSPPDAETLEAVDKMTELAYTQIKK